MKLKIFILFIVFNLVLSAQSNQTFLTLNTPMHSASIRKISTDNSNLFLLTCGDDKTAKLWELASKKLLRTFRIKIEQGNEGILNACALSPNGSIAALGGRTTDDNNSYAVYLFSTNSGDLLGRITGLKESVFDIKFSMYGDNLAVSMNGNAGVNIYSIPTSSKDFKISLVKKKCNLAGDNKASYLDFDVEGRLVTASMEGKIRLYDKTFKAIKESSTLSGKEVASVAFGKDGQLIAIGYSDSPNIDVVDGNSLQLLYNPNIDQINQKGAFCKLAFSQNGNYLYGGGNYVSKIDGKWWFPIRAWSLSGKGTYNDIKACQNIVSDIKPTIFGGTIFAGGNPDWGMTDRNDVREFYKAGEICNFANSQFKYLNINAKCSKIGFMPTGKNALTFSVSDRKVLKEKLSEVFYTDNKNGISITDWEDSRQPKFNGKIIDYLKDKVTIHCVDISSDGKTVIGGDRSIFCFDKNGKIIWELPVQNDVWAVKVSEDSKMLVSVLSNGTINWYKMKSGACRFLINQVLPNSLAEKNGLKAGDIITKVNGNEFFTRADFADILKNTNELDLTIIHDSNIFQKKIVKSESKIGFGYVGVDDVTLLMTLYVHPETLQWVLWTPEGYYDISDAGAESLVGWHVNQGKDKTALYYPLKQFAEKYFIPNLGVRILNNEDLGKQNLNQNISKQLILPPKVKIISPTSNSKLNQAEIEVKIEAEDLGGGVEDIRLYQNGKIVSEDQRGMKKVSNKKEKIYNIVLVPGKNELSATAFNRERTESNPDIINVELKSPEASSDLYVMAVGINEYKNPQYKLNYGKADAEGFSNALESKSKGIFKNIDKVTVFDTQADRINILKTLETIKVKSKASDVFILFYAGHGVMSETDNGGKSDFYLVPFDITQYTKEEQLKQKGISASELKQFCSEIKAQKQLLVLDACQSGGAVEAFAMRGAAEEKAILQLARSTGLVVFASTGTDQYATEFKQLGHGVFTYVIMKGLSGEADANKDGKVTVKELDAYLNDMVPELTQKYRGTAQYPRTWSSGMDFPVGIVK